VTTNRLEAFSDGVLAIATTLLVIETHPPEIHQGKTLAHALWAQWPSYLAYMVSFLTTRLRFMVARPPTPSLWPWPSCRQRSPWSCTAPQPSITPSTRRRFRWKRRQTARDPLGSSWTGLRQARDEVVGWLLIIQLIIQTILSSFPPRLRAVSGARNAFEESRGLFLPVG
jgi:hypothetical protein